MQVPKDYCLHIHAGLSVTIADNRNKIEISPCSYYPSIDVVDPVQNVFLNQRLIDFRNKPELDSICQKCIYRESIGQKCDARTSLINEFIDDDLLYDLDGPIFLRLTLDLTCNLACVICSPHFSSKWRSIEKIDKNSIVEQETVSKLFDNLNLKNLQRVQLMGGEPFLSKNHKLILEKLLPYSNQITLSYHTNVTVKVEDDILELWKSFKKVKIKFSIDAIGESFNYLRWPAEWRNIEENLLFYKDLPLENLELALTPAVGIINLFLLNDLKLWYVKNFKKTKNNQINFEPLPVEGLFELSGMSQEMINDAKEIYKNQPSILKYIPTLETKNRLRDVKKRLNELDLVRNLNYTYYLPQLIKYLPK